MPNRYRVLVTRGALRTQREYEVPDGGRKIGDGPARRGGGTNAGETGLSTAGRVIRNGGWSMRSRNTMRFEFSGMRWEELGRRPAMVTLTYPGDWRTWAASGPDVQQHMKRFKSRWARRWGEPIRGVWVREFQERRAPHFHLYVGLPEGVSNDDYDALVRRTMRRKRLERTVGKYEARRSAGLLEGEFGRWLLEAWSGSVGTGPRTQHAKFGADVAPMFWGATAVEAAAGRVNWDRIADYLWRESGKWGQKTAPEDFPSPGRAWGRWGVSVAVAEAEVRRAVSMEIRRVQWEVYRRRDEAERARRGLPYRRLPKPRGSDGMTLFNFPYDDGLSLLRWAEDVTSWKAQRTAESDGGTP